MKVERESMDVIEASRKGSIVFGIVVGAIIVLFCVSLMFHSSLIFGTPVFWWPTVLLIIILLILGILIMGAVIDGNTRKQNRSVGIFNAERARGKVSRNLAENGKKQRNEGAGLP